MVLILSVSVIFQQSQINRPEWPSTHQCTILKIPFWDFMDGMKLSATWSASFYFSFWTFFFFWFFFSSYMFFFPQPFCTFTFFSSGDSFFLPCFFWPHPWPQFFLGTSYLPLQRIYHPSSYQPTYLPHTIDLCLHWPPSLELQNQGELHQLWTSIGV